MCNWFRKAIDCVFHISHSRRFDGVLNYSFRIFFFAVFFETVYHCFAFDWHGSWIFLCLFVCSRLFFSTALILASKCENFSSISASMCFSVPSILASVLVSSSNVLNDPYEEFFDFMSLLWLSSTIFVNASDILFMLTFDSLHLEFHLGHCLFEL